MQTTPASNQTIWKQAYQEALFEIDPTRLPEKLEAADKAIRGRLSELCNGASDRRELTQLEDAKQTIAVLLDSLERVDARPQLFNSSP
jgi:hypothetical protein